MYRKAAFVCLLVLLFAIPVGNSLKAGPPFKLSLPFAKRVEADPRGDYRLNHNHGPWVIMAASFLGESGEVQARDLVLELRREHNLPAYIYRHRIDHSSDVGGVGWEPDPRFGYRPKRMRHYHLDQFDEIAVMVGDFDSFDSPKAQKALTKIKHLKPQSMRVSEQVKTSQRFGVFREIQRRITGDPEQKRKGPMRAAFITPNPTIPEEYFTQRGPDKFIMDLNRGIEYSLLSCPKPYSVRVASFRGNVTSNLNEIQQEQQHFNILKRRGGGTQSKLAEAADKAIRLTAALRKRDVEAYVFHDRHESYVCVGSFDWVGEDRPDGRKEINPAIYQVIERFRAKRENIPGLQGAMVLTTLPELPQIGFDVQPVPVAVPNKNAHRGFSGSRR